MADHICKECGYKVKGSKKERCSYCGKKSLEKEKSASELVDNVKV